ncbi:glycosyltransferase involved in cell wall biosynthesis [Nocardioides thalensis]|uniref:Glycosyltransferase involved in cell wall biosynthesis n=1 Tax=Nocardioides thalensis TaxID=1914755 RepID=A0A853C9E3_9ACTN|nr:glycosyltransferase family 4 protein [Nocardioides thalensis]NYJ02843.1 glycosyltransferase involved in cell wall biosynthesis [Nocardioides thalensis]
MSAGQESSPAKLSIGVVLPGLSRAPAGGYKVVYDYCNDLAGFGHRVTIYHAPLLAGARNRARPHRERLSDFVRHLGVRRQRPRWHALSGLVMVKNSPRLDVRRIGYHDVLVATAAETAPLVLEAAAASGAAGAYFIQHDEQWVGAEQRGASWRLPLQHIVIAPWLRQISEAHGHRPILVPNAIDTTHFSDEAGERDIAVLAMISDKPFKRPDLVIQAMNRLAADGETCVTFGTIDRPAALDPRVVHHREPSRDLLRRLYASAQVYLCASDAEGWHLPPAEAMASGCSVVSTAIPGVLAYADDVGLFAPVGDGPGLIRHTRALLGDPAQRQDRGARGAALMRSYTPDDAARAFEAALHTARARA